MARPKLKTARKDYPNNGVKKGDKYWFVSIKTGPRSSRTLRQLQPFKPQQLTSSEFLSAVYDLQDRIEQLSVDDVRDELQSIADDIRSLGEEQYDKLQNMPDGLQQGPTGEMLQGRQDSCEEWASNLEDIIGQLPDEPEGGTEEVDEPVGTDYETSELFDEAWFAWNVRREELEEYTSSLEECLSDAQGYMYEGE